MTDPGLDAYQTLVREQVHALTRTLTKVMFGDFECIARTTQPDELFGYLASMINVAINAARNAQSDLRRSHARLESQHRILRDVVEGTGEAVFLKDDGGHYKMINAVGARILGHTPDQVIGKTDLDLLPAGLANQLRAQDAEVFRTEAKVTRESLWPDDSGPRTVLTTKTPYRHADGTIAGLIGISRDITERAEAERRRTELEEQLRQSQKMEAIGQLAGGIAHDFNNLLTVVLGATDSLRANVTGEDLESVTVIQHAAEHAASLTHQLLTFSRKRAVLAEVLDLNTIVAEMETVLKRLVGTDIDLVIGRSPEAAVVHIDPVQAEQVIMNLVVNARDAMPKGGTIEVSVRHQDSVEDSAPADVTPGRCVVLEIRDTGCGMDAETASRVFEPFFTTKAAGDGTGLGLSTVYGIVKQAQGHISLQTAPGRGTCFRVRLPAESGSQPKPPAAATARARRGKERILLVEDTVEVRDLTRRLLQRHGYHVDAAHDSESALRRLAELDEPIDLLLTDIVMPGAGGHSLARRVLAEQPGVRVLMMSGYAQQEAATALLRHHGTAFLRKPFRSGQLLQAIGDLLESPRRH